MRRRWSSVYWVWLVALSVVPWTLVAQEPAGVAGDKVDSLHDEDARELAVVERFVTVLEKNPRRGTALDKVYAFHVERGSLGSTIAAYREKADKGSGGQADKGIGGQGDKGREKDAAVLWMIVGLLEALRGDEAAAVTGFENAERLAPENALAPYYLGQMLVLTGQSDKAVEAFERAIVRQPARADLLEMFQTLGRIHQRTARNEKALDVWNRLEQQFPNDERVQEQIATTLLEEEAFDAALPRFEKLAQTAKDRPKQLAFRMEAADIRVRLGQTDVALKEFEALLGQLNPDHWVYREVRRRIEAIYLRSEDRAGLATYYEAWLAKHPDDLDAIARVAKVYATIGRDAESREWLERGVKLAPTRKELRRALIDRLLEWHKYGEALAHYEQLDRHDPNNPDTLRDWGRVLLLDSSRDEAARRQAAAAIWRKLAEAKPNDPLVASQVGDLLRQAELIDEAVAQYRRAIALAPEATQYREYLGEYFHSLKRSEEALATWRPMAEGDRRTAANVGRLAEVLAGYGYVEEAIKNYAEACRLDPKDLGMQLKRIDLLARAERHEEVIPHLATVEKLVANEEEREAWLSRDLRTWQAMGKLKERIAAVQKEGQGDKGTRGAGEKNEKQMAERWYWLARAHEAERQMSDAAHAVKKAGELAPRSIPILRASARILEARRDLFGAVEVCTRLVTLDRRYRTEYLQQLATLERQLGRKDKALQAGRDLMAAAPGNPEQAEFFAQLCFQLGQVDEGLNALRRSARANANDPLALVRLATALIERQRAGEAIDLLWRAFDTSPKLEDRLLVVQKLVEAHAAANQPSRVIERLQRLQRDRSQRREMTLCLAQAHQASGNDAQALKELETLLSEETRDPLLLKQLVQLAEKRQDWTTAANYMRQVWQLTKDKRDRFQLADLLMKVGQVDEAVELLVGGESSRQLTAEVLKLLDGLYETGKTDVLLARLKPLRDRFPDNWELLYREGIALAKAAPEEAAGRFEAILALHCRDDEPALATPPNSALPVASLAGTPIPLVDRMSKIAVIMQMTSFMQSATSSPSARLNLGTPRNTSGRTPAQARLRFWAPRDYGEVRLAAWGWLTSFAARDKQPEKMTARLRQLESSSTHQSLIDRYAIHRFRGEEQQAEKVAHKLAQSPGAGPEEKSLYLQALAQRHQPKRRIMPSGQAVMDQPSPAPLYDEELDEVLAIYRELVAKADTSTTNPTQLNTIMAELVLADRAAVANQLMEEAIDRAANEAQLNALMLVASGLQTAGANRPGARTTSRMTRATLLRMLDRQIQFQDETAANRVAATATMPAPATVLGSLRGRATPNYTGYVIQMHLHTHGELLIEEVLALWSRYVKLSSFSLAERLRQPEGRPAAVQLAIAQQTSAEMSLGPVFDENGLLILVLVLDLSTRDKNGQGVLADFQSRSQSPDISNEERILWLTALGHLHGNTGDKESALKAWTAAAALAPQFIELQLNLARIHELHRQSQRALEIVEATQPTTNDWQVEREQMILRLALAANNRDRATVAAERLSGLKLNPFDVLPLAEQMVKLDLTDQAEALLLRSNNMTAGNRTPVDIRALRVLLDIQLARGRNDEATQTALDLLKLLETTDPRKLAALQAQQFAAMNNGQRMIINNVNGRQSVVMTGRATNIVPEINVSEYRLVAFKALHKTGKLAEMIDKAETELKASPNNEAVIKTLLTYHTVAVHSERIEELRARLLEIELNRPDKRYAMITDLLNRGLPDEAASHARLLMEAHPDHFVPRCRDMIFRFENKNGLRKLAKVFEQLDWSRYDKYPELLPMVIEQLAADITTEDIAAKLFVTAWETRPERRLELLTYSPDEEWWKRPELTAGLCRLPIPAKEADLANQWAVFGRTLRKPTNKSNVVNDKLIPAGKTTDGAAPATLLSRLLAIEANRDQLKTLAGEVERGRQQFPQWTAGQVLLALIDLRRGRVATGRDALIELLPTLSKLAQNSPAIPWEIADELARHDESYEAGIRYYEVALRDRGIEAWTSSTSPVRGIIQSLAARGRTADARRMLLSLLPANVQRGGDPALSPSTLELNVAQWVGRELRGIGHPIDAIHVYQAALERGAGMTIGGHDPRVDLQSSLLIAFKELQPASLIDFFAATGDAPPSLDLQLFVTELTTPGIRLRSRWQSIVGDVAQSPEAAARLQGLLADARRKHPGQLVAFLLSAQLAVAMNDDTETAASVGALVHFVEQHPLEVLSSEPAKLRSQREAARSQVGLWLIARESLAQPALAPAGTKLAERALQAARQQTDPTFAQAVGTEWLTLARQANDTTTVDRLQRELSLPLKP